MQGYLKVKTEKQNLEVESLELSDCEFVEEGGNDHWDFISREELENLISILGHRHACPRCKGTTNITGSAPYCSDCNWDSLTDPAYESEKWAA